MTLRWGWYVPDQISYYEFSGIVTLEDMRAAVENTARINKASHVHHNITDVRKMEQMPHSLKDILRSVKMLDGSTTTGWAIVIGKPNSIVQFVISTMGQLFRFKFRWFNSMEEALHFLNSMDDTLPPLLPEREIILESLIHAV